MSANCQDKGEAAMRLEGVQTHMCRQRKRQGVGGLTGHTMVGSLQTNKQKISREPDNSDVHPQPDGHGTHRTGRVSISWKSR